MKTIGNVPFLYVLTVCVRDTVNLGLCVFAVITCALMYTSARALAGVPIFVSIRLYAGLFFARASICMHTGVHMHLSCARFALFSPCVRACPHVFRRNGVQRNPPKGNYSAADEVLIPRRRY